jgi:hypothetical protein
MSYQFTRYQSRYREEVVQLQTAAAWIPDLALSAAYLAWKYDQNPYLNEPHIYLAVQNKRVVGMRGLCGAQWKIGQTGQNLVLPCAGDTIIAPEHRSQGLLRQLLRFQHADLALAAFPYILSFSAGAPVSYCSLSEGWRIVGAYGTLVRTSPIRKLFRLDSTKNFARSWQRHPVINKLWRVATQLRRPALGRAEILTSSDPRVEEMAWLVARTESSDKIRQHKDPRYYAWRFRSPLSRYRFLYWQRTTLEGFLVLQRSSESTLGPVRVVDWAAATPEVLIDLLQAAVREVGLSSLEIWSATLPETLVAALGEQSFMPAQNRMPHRGYRQSLLARCPNAALLDCEWNLVGRDITNLENWELSMLCSDQY